MGIINFLSVLITFINIAVYLKSTLVYNLQYTYKKDTFNFALQYTL